MRMVDTLWKVSHLVTSLDDNFDEVNAAIAALDTSDLTAFVQDFNILWGSLYSNLEYFCVNGCETCLETGTCGIWETSSSVRSTFEEGNFTLDDILSLDLSSGLPMFSSNATDCVTYTQNLDGTMCYGIFRQDLEDSECSIAYNGVPCTSCLIYYIDSNKTMGCLQADCTNIQSEAAIDSCFDSGFVGPFEFLHFVQSNFLVSNNFDVGLCVGSAVPTPTNTSVAPTEAPVDPTDTPVAPTNAPISPTNAPVTQTEAPVTPTSIPAAPTDVPTEAPVYGVPTSFPTDDPTMVGPNGSVAADQSAPVSSASSTVVSIGAVIGSVVGGMLLMAVIGFVIYMHRKTKDDTELKKNASIFREFPESSGGTNTSHDAHNSSSNNTCVVPSVTAAPFTAIHRVPNANNRDDVILLSPGTPVGHPLTYKGQCQSFAKAGHMESHRRSVSRIRPMLLTNEATVYPLLWQWR